MSIWSTIWDALTVHAEDTDVTLHDIEHMVNPATGLPMVGDSCGGVDVGGSPFGIDNHALFDSQDSYMGGGSMDFEIYSGWKE